MRTLFLTVALLGFGLGASACDVCGCSIGGNYFGILPQFHRHFVGLRWSEQSFRSAHSRSSAEAGNFHSDERFRTVELLGRFYPLPRLQVLTLVPYHDFSRSVSGQPTHSRGLGDVSVLGNFILLDTGDSSGIGWKHTLGIGGGVKLSSGQHRLKNAEGLLLHENMQPGSGSTDFMLSATYTLRRGAWGLAADVLGRLNTANREGYQFGNRASGSAKIFYWKNLRNTTLLPNAGVFAEHAAPNRNGQSFADGTGGDNVMATLGMDVYLGRFSAGFTLQQPLYQDLGEGSIRANTRWMATVNYIF